MTFPFAVRALHLLFFLFVGTFRFPKTMKIRYSAEVDPDVDYPKQEFLDLLQIYLADPDGWESKGHTFIYDPKGPVKIRLSSPATIAKTCGVSRDLSCAELGGRHLYLNASRWKHGAKASQLPLDSYRQYMVSHEMGHILGHEHVKCVPGKPAPIMLQQTLGLKGCTPNTKV